jgi:hypothetical protein
MLIELTDLECTIAQQVGLNRNSINRKINSFLQVKSKHLSSQEIDVDGAGAELAVSKAMNVYPDFTVNGPQKYHDIELNGKKIEIKSTRYKTGCLLIPPNQKDWDIDAYILLTGSLPQYTFAGGCFKSDIITEKRYGIFKSTGNYSYYMEQKDLPLNFASFVDYIQEAAVK